MKLLFSLISLTFFACISLQAQTISVFPTNPKAEDSVTITFYADKGNAALKDFEGNVYIHTGVIIGTPDEPSGWRYVQGNWGKADERMLMRKIEANIYEYKLHIASFYGFSEEEPFLQLAMVFRNEDGTRVAKEEGEKDIFYLQIKTYPNGILESVSGKDGDDVGDFKGIIEGEHTLQLICTQQTVHITHITDDIISVSLRKNRTQPDEFNIAVIQEPTIWNRKISQDLNEIQITWGQNYQLRIQKHTLRLAFYRADTLLFKDEMGFFDDKIEHIAGTRLALSPKEHIYGTGSRAINIDRRGQRVYTYNTATFGYTAGETKLNLSIPYIQSSRCYGLFFDNPRRGYFDMGKTEENVLEYGVKDSALTYYVILGNTHEKVVENYTYLTGRQALPPIWVLSFMQSRFGYKSREETEDIAEKTLAAGYPLEATLLDLYWFGDLPKMGNFSFDLQKFPRPSEMILRLKNKGVKTILITESYFVNTSTTYKEADSLHYFAKLANGNTAKIPDFWAGPAALLDIYQPDAQKWFWKKYADLWQKYAIHGWWCDSGEPENHPKRMIHKIGTAEEAHNLYPLYWAKMISDNHSIAFPTQRLFNLARSGYAGVQRYNIFPWSGDVSRSWEAMRAQTSIMLGAGTCGIGYMHSDLGGFTGGPLDEELYTRWLQMGAFVPVMRAHGSGLPSEPIFFSETTQQNVKEAIKLRYRLLPYNYNLCFENSQKGLPLARPLYYYYPKDEYLMQTDDAYMWGENLLIAPIFEKENRARKVSLPMGKWFDFHSFTSWWGGGFPITVPAFDDRVPVFVKAGSFIPTAPEIMHTSQYKTDTLLINYFPDLSVPQTSYNLYNDDGETPDAYTKKRYNIIHFSGKNTVKNISIKLESEETYPTMPNKRFFVWGVNNLDIQPKSVQVGKKKLAVIAGSPAANLEQAFYDAETKRLVFYVDWDNVPLEIKIEGQGILKP